MRTQRRFAGALLALSTVGAAPSAPGPAERLQADTVHLASDALQGRDTGSRGHEAAAAFVAERFKAAGLVPGGDRGGWLQQVPLRRTVHSEPPRITLHRPGRRPVAVSPRDFALRPNIRDQSTQLQAGTVFVGHGISEPQLGIDEYAGLDVRGRIAVALRGTPSGLPQEIAAHLEAAKDDVAAAKGAAGFAELSFGGFLRYNPAASISSQPVLDWTDRRSFGDAGKLHASMVLSPDASRRIFEGAPRSLESVRASADKAVPGFYLQPRLVIRSLTRWQDFTSPNVVGVLPGSDPALQRKPVVVMAHLDHLGLDPGGGDKVFNGAIDNSAGVAIMIEVARSLAAGPRLRRPVWFVAVTGEERGLLGSDYFAQTANLEIAGMINLDMPLITYDFSDIVAFGAQHSSLGRAAASAASQSGVGLSPDPMPEQSLFVRSDHYRFVTRGIPALFLMTGYGNGGRAAWQSYLGHTYHRPSDEVSPRLNWTAGARFAAINARIVRAVANDPQPPLWYEGDYFGNRFAPGQPRRRP